MDGRNVTIWDAVTEMQVLTLKGQSGLGGRAVFSPDGKRLACVDGYDNVKIWNATPLDDKPGQAPAGPNQ